MHLWDQFRFLKSTVYNKIELKYSLTEKEKTHKN